MFDRIVSWCGFFTDENALVRKVIWITQNLKSAKPLVSRPSKPTKSRSTVLRIIAESNTISVSTKATENRIGINQTDPMLAMLVSFQGSVIAGFSGKTIV